MLNTLIFDLDGTISDPIEGISKSVNFALREFGFSEITEKAIAPFIGPPINETFVAFTKSDSKDLILKMVAKFRERYNDIGYSENKLYPNVVEAVSFLKQQQVPLGVCTSKKIDFAEKILEMFGLRIYFDFVSGGDVGIKKEEQLKDLLQTKVINNNSIMIGDRDVDIIAAKNNGLRSAGVLWGYGSKEELEKEQPDFIFSSPAELKTLILPH